MGRDRIDFTNQVFGRLTVLYRVGDIEGRSGWMCSCECGVYKKLSSKALLAGVKSCGCLRKEMTSDHFTKYGGISVSEIPKEKLQYTLWHRAKYRAKTSKRDFDITPDDIKIPPFCPLLGIPLKSRIGQGYGPNPNSPTVDRIDSKLGYVKGNVWIISHRANCIKNDATLEELQLLTKNLELFLKK